MVGTVVTGGSLRSWPGCFFGSGGTGTTGGGVVGTVLTGGSLWSWFRSPRPLPGFFFDSDRTGTTGGCVVGTVLTGGVRAGGVAAGEATGGVEVTGGGVVGVVTGGPLGFAGGGGLGRFLGGLGRFGSVRFVVAGRTSTAGRTIAVFAAARRGCAVTRTRLCRLAGRGDAGTCGSITIGGTTA